MIAGTGVVSSAASSLVCARSYQQPSSRAAEQLLFAKIGIVAVHRKPRPRPGAEERQARSTLSLSFSRSESEQEQVLCCDPCSRLTCSDCD